MIRPTMCFIDTMRPTTAAEKECWSCYLALHRDYWRPAKIMFRKVHQGSDPGLALLEFGSNSGLDDVAMQRRLEDALWSLAAEVRA